MLKIRKYAAAAIAFVLLFTMIIPVVAFASVDYSYIRVKLDSIGTPASVQFKVAGAYRIAEASSVDLFPNVTYTMKVEGSGQKLTYSNGASTVSVSLPSTVTFVQYANSSSNNFLYVNNPGCGWHYYAGDMKFVHPSGTSYLQLINKVFTETYLYGVVSSEMANDWPLEALKAQAVCARTYAMSYIRSRQGTSYAYDIVDTSANQVYKGYPCNADFASPQTNVINAVDATRGMVILLGNAADLNFADGMYSASDGGQINTMAMRNGGTNTYHVFKDDPYDLANPSSPKYVYYFPKNVSSLSAADNAKAQSTLSLIADKLPAALAARGITATKDQITINGIKSATPVSPRAGMPTGSNAFTQVSVVVNVTVGNTTIPVAGVSYTGTAMASGDTTPQAGDGTDFGVTNVTGGQVSKTYTISNSGNTTLHITGITMSGGSTGDFSVTSPSSFPMDISAGSNATFTVLFDPTSAGDRSTTVTIASNDVGSPYAFSVKGKGLNNFSSFQFASLSPSVAGNYDGTSIAASVPYGTDLTSLVASFAVTSGSIVTVGGVVQQSGVTPNDFTHPVTYTVTGADSSTTQYTVTVTAPGTASAPSALLSAGDTEPAPDASLQAGGGGAPASATCDITLTLTYISKASDNSYSVLGDLRDAARFSNSLIQNTAYMWELYSGSDSTFVYVTARGYGHGLGMSQRGAQEMANESKNYQTILDFYFNMSAGKSTLGTVNLMQKTLSAIPGKGSSASFAKASSTLTVRAAASSSGTQVASLPKDTIVEVLSSSGGWSKILYPAKGVVGYASATYLKKTTSTPMPLATASPTPVPTATPTATATVSSTLLNTATPTPGAPSNIAGRVLAPVAIHSSASNTSSTVYTLKKGDTVVILDTNAGTDWYKVQFASFTGYAVYQSGANVYIEAIGATPAGTVSPSATPGNVTLKAVTAKVNVTGNLTLRSKASTSGSKVTMIPSGSSVTVLSVSTTTTWLRVSYSGKTGYVQAKSLIISGNTANKAGTATVANLSARAGAGPGNAIVTTLKKDDTVTVTGKVSTSSGTWYKIAVGSSVAYVDSRYLRVSKTS